MSLNTQKYFNRDLSWLQFNHRVLQEAADRENPLFERIKFLAIFSSNLDEFFKVRVSDIRQIKTLDKAFRKKLITKPNKLLKEIKKQVHIQQEKFGAIFKNEILPELQDAGIELIDYTKFNSFQKEYSQKYYRENFLKKLEIEFIDAKDLNHTFFLENEELYLVSSAKNGQFIFVKIPTNSNRFIVLPSANKQHYITFIDDILKDHLCQIYQDQFYALKISRDAELYIENEYSGVLLDKIKASLGNRITGQITRVLIDSKIPLELLEQLKSILDVNDTDLVQGSTYHNFKDFFGFPNPTNKNLSHDDLPLLRNEALLKNQDPFKVIKKKDILLHYPYETFEHILEIVKAASIDSKVTKIKITLYRVSKDSQLASILIDAAKNGKDVFVFIETKARFDEANNMKWGAALQQAGAQVLYSYPGIKIHSKILYIERIEKKGLVQYGYISTGNFNGKTAKIYTDFGLLTSNPIITSDLLQVFQVLDKSLIIPKPKQLLVSPFNTRKKMKKLILNEIKNATLGVKASIILKLNSLQDKSLIDLLYEANNAGVQIRLVVRGICCLVPGIPGQSEHIHITSIVDRFLEHGRIYLFENGGKEKMYIGSADWMTRNLDHRIEVMTPILDNDVFLKLKHILKLQLNDNVKARIIDAKQENKYVNSTVIKNRAQVQTHTFLSKEINASLK